jgi:hypothetical protein
MAGKEDRVIEPHRDMYITKVSTSKGKDKFLEYVLSNYDGMQTQDIKPMFVYKSLNTGETSMVIDAKDTEALSAFIKTRIRSREEVRSVKVDNLVRPVFFPLPDDMTNLKRFAVTVACEPMTCKGIYKQMLAVGDNGTFTITMVAYIMNDNGQHVTMSVLTENLGDLNSFVEKHVSGLEGASKIMVSELAHLRKLSTRFEWKKTVQPIAEWEAMIGRDYGKNVYDDVNQGC